MFVVAAFAFQYLCYQMRSPGGFEETEVSRSTHFQAQNLDWGALRTYARYLMIKPCRKW